MTPHCGTQALVLRLFSSAVLLRRCLKVCSGDPKAVYVETFPSSSVITSKEQAARVNFQKKTCFCFPFHWGKKKIWGVGYLANYFLNFCLWRLSILCEHASSPFHSHRSSTNTSNCWLWMTFLETDKKSLHHDGSNYYITSQHVSHGIGHYITRKKTLKAAIP